MAVTINADTSNGLVMTPDTSGEIKLQSGGTDIATVDSSGITMASGKVLAPTGPAFSAYASTDQTLTNNVWTKIAIDTERYDTDSCFDTSTYRFTPNVAGYYQVNVVGRMDGATYTIRSVGIYKNGDKYATQAVNRESTSSSIVVSGSDLIYMNGSTDYLECFCLAAVSSGTPKADAFSSTDTSLFSAFLARAA